MKKAKILIYILVLVVAVWLLSIRVGAETTRIKIEAQLEKYINYNMPNQETGTLVQYQVTGTIEYGEEQEHFPIKKSEITMQLSQIDGKYPKSVKVLNNFYEYDANTGIVTIKAENVEEQTEYRIICDYDTYVEENQQRQIGFQLKAQYNLETEQNNWLHEEGSFTTQVEENIKELTSIDYQTKNLYNGNIKSNQINGTNYPTIYEETESIMISKKEDISQIELRQSNGFIKIEEDKTITDLGNHNNLIYQSTKIEKQDLIQVLGEEGQVEIFDNNENQLGTINKDNEIIVYEEQLEAIILRTTPVQNEGILTLEHTKQIKETMVESQNIKIKTTSQINEMEKEALFDLQEATTHVEASISNLQWTNQQQNEIIFEIRLNSEIIENNMLHHPQLKIKLPKQVEKVILGDTSLYYANGLELQTPYLETDENGNQFIIVNLQGKQTQYHENNINLATEIKVLANIILKKELENTKEKVEIQYTNQYTLDGSIEEGTKELEIEIKNSQNETEVEKIENYQIAKSLQNEEQNLKLEIAPIKGETSISNGDIIYEGEYIKYNIKVTNTSEQTIHDVKVQATIPEGTIYGELNADYHNRLGEYTYHFYEDIKSKEIEIGSIKAGESISRFYEVQVKDLPKDLTEKQITTNLQAKIGETQVANYQITNVVKPAEFKVFLSSNLYGETNRWNYHILVTSDQYDKQPVTVTVKLPKTFEIEYFNNKENGQIEYYEENRMPEGNVFTISVRTNEEGYYLSGFINPPDASEQNKESKMQLIATASVNKNNHIYQSNENRIDYTYENVAISMTSETEGEEVKYGEEINYKITVTNIGKNNLNDPMYSYIPVQITDFLPQNVKPVSVTYDNWEIEKIEQQEGKGIQITGNYHKLEPITKELTSQMEDEEGQKYPNIDLELEIPYQESVNIEIKTTAEPVYEKTKIENQASVKGVEGRNIAQKNSNIITHTIVPFLSEEEPDNPDIPDVPEQPDKPDETYSIAGVAWLDENEDGKRQENEKLLNGITVTLIDTNHNNEEKSKTITNNKGAYFFSNIEKGNYLVIFDYDITNYSLTTYQKKGVPNHLNSDVTNQTITLGEKTKQVGITDVISLNQSILDIDIGLIKHKKCDLKIDKSISKITITTKNGTSQYDYQNEKLAKIEIKAKEIEGATVVIEYKIAITNEGETPASVQEVIDQLPEGLSFSSELNQNWSQQNKGKVINTTISNQKIAVGERKELTLVLTKTMKSDATGTYCNYAKISGITNPFGTIDETEENNTSKAEVIISVNTGLVTYLSIAMLTIIIAVIIVFLSYRYGIVIIGKISLFTIMVGITLVTTTIQSQTQAYYNETYPKEASFVWDGKHAGGISNSHGFSGGPTGRGECQNQGWGAHGACTLYATPSGWIGYNNGTVKSTGGTTIVSQTNPTISVKNTNNEIQVRKVENNVIYGPFNISCDRNVGYTYEAYNSKGNKIATPVTCDVNGNYKTVTGTATFYLKMPIEECYNGVSKIKAIASYQANRITTYNTWGEIIYTPYPDDGCQRVATTNGYAQLGTGTTTEVVTVTGYAQWTNLRGFLEITKQDKEDSKKVLAGVKIQIECEDINYKKTVTTDEQGKIEIENLPNGRTYTITELENPNYGYTKMAVGKVKMNAGSYIDYKLLNEKQTGNLEITKQDKDILDENQKRLNNVSFKIKNSKGNYIIAVDQKGNEIDKVTGEILLSDLKNTQNQEQGTEFITNENGEIGIKNLLTDTYTIQEIAVGNHFGYEVDDDYIFWDNGTEEGTGANIPKQIQRQNSQDTKNYGNQVKVSNKKKYIKLSGYVWEDKTRGGKEAETNDLYYQEDNDERLKNVTVTLKKANGEIIDTKVTNTILNTSEQTEEGAYLFGDYQRDPQVEKIKIEDLEGSYLEFSYNGMCYQSVKIHTDVENGNKATDQNLREEFNNNYATITKGKAQNGNYNLVYEFEKHKSTLQYGEKENYLYGYEGQKYPIAGIDHQYELIANTKSASPDKLLGQEISMKQIYEKGIDEIKNINLGLKEREMPDLSIIQDVETAQVRLNGYTHTYHYEDRFSKLNEEIAKYIQEHPEDKTQFNVGVNFESKYGKDSYTTTIYSSDVIYKKEDENGNLDIFITYKIKLANEASNINTIINQLYNYHDQDFIVTNLTDENGNQLPYQYDENYSKIDQETGNTYRRILIQPQEGIKLLGASNQYIYITYQLQDEAILKILNADKVLGSATEIVAYSSYQDNDFKLPYAGIDRDSEPNNSTMGDDSTYEDDMDQAPALKLTSRETRSIEGTIWQEDAMEELLKKEAYDKERIGNGKYDEEVENVVENVQVELLKINEESGKEETSRLYPVTGLVEANQTTTKTDKKGNYRFEGVIPGKYILRFTYKNNSILYNTKGEKLGTLQDIEGGVEYYKSASYRTITDENNRDNINQEAYQKTEQNTNENYLYWYADETKRENAIRMSDARDNRELVQKRTSVEEIGYEQALQKETGNLEEISANTSLLEIRLDCDANNIKNISKDNSQYGTQRLEYRFDNIDFGIIRRPKQNLSIKKQISDIELSLASGQLLVKGNPQTQDLKHIKYLPDGNVHIEIDDEIIQSANLKLEYELIVNNKNCEMDYNSEDYYDFGIRNDKTKNWKIATVLQLFDYPSNQLEFESQKNRDANWKVIKLADLKGKGRLSKEAEKALEEYNVILATDKFASMKPGEERTETMQLSRLLANVTANDFSFENKTEINLYDGRKMDYTIPGNYNPNNSATNEKDNDEKNIAITGATGENKHDLPYFLLGITSFILFGTGVIVIKKKVLG